MKVDIRDELAKRGVKVWTKSSSPTKPWKHPRPLWYAKVPHQYYALCRELGGHLQWGQKFMFWEDPTERLLEEFRKENT